MIKLKEILESDYSDMVSLFESPLNLRKPFNPNELDSLGKNHLFTVGTIERAKKIDKFNEYDVYEYQVGEDKYSILIKDDYYTHIFFKYKVVNDIVEENLIWQFPTSIGLCRAFMFDYFLKKYDGVMSDNAHTEFGKKYWDKLLKAALKLKYKIFALYKNEKIPLEHEVTIEKFYFDSPKGLDYKFLILK